MLEKVIAASVLAGCALCATVGGCAAGAPDQFELAQNYEKDGYFRQAESIYRKLATDNKDIDKALAARKNLALLYVRMDHLGEFSRALAELIENSSEHKGLLDTLHDVVRRYRYGSAKGRPGNAVEAWFTHQQIQRFANHPETGRDLLAVRAMNAMILIEMEEAAGAEAIDALICDYSEHPELPRGLWYIAERYTGLQQYDRAKGIYEVIVANCRHTDWAVRAEPMIPAMEVLKLIESGDHTGAGTAVERLRADFTGHPGLPGCAFSIAAGYERSGKYEQALKAYDEAFLMYPDSRSAVYSQTKIALVYSRLRLHDKAIRIRRAMVENYPDSGWAPYEQCAVGHAYRDRGDYGQAIREYQKVIELYPDSSAAGSAARSIARIKRYSAR